MTDFIHEHPAEQPAPAPEQKPVSEREQQKKVFAYIAILFTVAFLLILWSFFSTHRSNQQVISELKDSSSFLQNTILENDSLEARVAALEETTEALEAELAEAKAQLKDAQDAAALSEASLSESAEVACAMDWLRDIQSAYAARNYNHARSMIRAFASTGLADKLSAEPLHSFDGSDADSPAATYEKICDVLFPDGVIQ